MVREPGQFNILPTVVPLGKGDAEDAGCGYGITPEGFVEIAYAEEHQCIGVLCLYTVVLLHQRSFGLEGLGHDLFHLLILPADPARKANKQVGQGTTVIVGFYRSDPTGFHIFPTMQRPTAPCRSTQCLSKTEN